eukprot:EG_transcript_7810
MHGGVAFSRIAKVFITHLHADHCLGLPTVLSAVAHARGATDEDLELHEVSAGHRCAEAPAEVEGEGSTSVPVVDIFGPWQLGRLLRTCLCLTYSGLPIRYRVHEALPESVTPTDVEEYLRDTAHVSELRPRFYRAVDGYFTFLNGSRTEVSVKAAELLHHPGVFCLGYVMQEPDRPGKLDQAALKQKGVPKGPLFQRLKNGESVRLDNGAEVHPGDVSEPPTPGRKCVILGDTHCSTRLAPLAAGADLVVHEATFDDATAHLAEPKGHSTARMAGCFARDVGAQCLAITHFSSRFCSSSRAKRARDGDVEASKRLKPDVGSTAEDAVSLVKHLVDEARAGFGSDKVVAAEDFLTLRFGREGVSVANKQGLSPTLRSPPGCGF